MSTTTVSMQTDASRLNSPPIHKDQKVENLLLPTRGSGELGGQ